MVHNKEEFRNVHCRGPVRFLGILARVLMGIGVATAFAFVFAILVKALWNWIMPGVFGLGEIGFWQAFGLLLLAKIFFGGHGHGDHHSRSSHNRIHNWFHPDPREPGGLQREAWIGGRDSKTRDYFNEFWAAEGRDAFELFISLRRSDSESQSAPGGDE